MIVHGIHTNTSKAAWMDYVANKFFENGWCAHKFNYGYAVGLLTRYQNHERAMKLASIILPGDVVLGHSNGGTLIDLAANMGAPIEGAILLNPALDEDRVMPEQVKWVNLYPNRHDVAVKISALFLAHQWGAQGHNGISREDARYTTTFTDDLHYLSNGSELPMLKGHSDIIHPYNLPAWTERIIEDANKRYVN